MADVVIAGAAGRMGSRLVANLQGDKELRLVAALEAPGHPALGKDVGEGAGGGRPAAAGADEAAGARWGGSSARAWPSPIGQSGCWAPAVSSSSSPSPRPPWPTSAWWRAKA